MYHYTLTVHFECPHGAAAADAESSWPQASKKHFLWEDVEHQWEVFTTM